jgi:hypothetical protein
MTDDPAFRPETLSTWEPAPADVELWTVDECDEQIADAQYVLDHPGEYDPSIREAARRSLGLYERYRAYAARIEELERELADTSTERDDFEASQAALLERLAAYERVVEAASIQPGSDLTSVGHWTGGGVHWYDPRSTPMPGCVLCAALAALKEEA